MFTKTENGADAYTAAGVGDSLVALWFKLVRGLDRGSLRELMADAAAAGGDQIREDLMVMAFQLRDVRNGKGERDLFVHMLLECFTSFPAGVLALLPKVGEYGCWRDLKLLVAQIDDDIASGAVEATRELSGLRSAALDAMAKQLLADRDIDIERDSTPPASAADDGDNGDASEAPKLSLCAKWAPRESQKRFKAQARELALRVCPAAAGASGPAAAARSRRSYRQLLSHLNTRLHTVELKMCSGRWAEIAPHALPARCLHTRKAALLNQPATRGALKRAEVEARRCGKPAESLLRCAADDEDRITCAESMVRHLAAGKGVHGRTVDVHSLVNTYLQCQHMHHPALGGKRAPDAPDLVAEAQWADIRRKYSEAAADPDSTCALGKYVVLADVSGSMSGDPMAVAIGLAVLVSELAHPAFRDKFVTFESEPHWHSLAGLDTLHAKVRSAAAAPWGGSTNFAKAMRLLLDTCVSAHLGADEVPEALIVVSDMQFDCANRGDIYGSGWGYAYGGGGYQQRAQPEGWSSEYAKIKAAWDAENLPCPEIIFWNVRANTNSFPAAADTEGVQMVSGFSHNLLKLFMEGEGEEVDEEEEEEVEASPGAAPPARKKRKKLATTPLATMRRALDNEAYSPLRDALRACAAMDATSEGREAVFTAAAGSAQRHDVVLCASKKQSKSSHPREGMFGTG